MNPILSHYFSEFDTEPIASGAIAQVYKARLLDGREVAVKVRHPDITDIIALDLSLLVSAARFADFFSICKAASLPNAAAEFSKVMINQVDLRLEALHMIKFRRHFEAYKDVVIFPQVLGFCSQDVLIESFCPGLNISQFFGHIQENPLFHQDNHHHLDSFSSSSSSLSPLIEKQPPSSHFQKKLAYLGMSIFLKMLIDDNFVHSDMHPGNMLVTAKITNASWLKKATIQPVMVILDVGLVVRLTPQDRENFLALFWSVVKGDGRQGAMLMIERSPVASLISQEDKDKFVEEMERLLSTTMDQELSKIPIGETLLRVLEIARTYNVRLESNFVSLLTGILTIEGVARQLNADFNLREEAKKWMLTAPGVLDRVSQIRQFFTESDTPPSFENESF